MLITLGILLAIVALFFTDYVSIGRIPHGARLERCRKSPNFQNGRFVNPEPTKLFTDAEKKQSTASIIWNFLTGSKKGLKPEKPTEASPLDTEAIEQAIKEKQNKIIWFGHSSYLLVIDGKTILVDPVLFRGSPISFINRPFKGTSIYRPQDFPFIDYLVYTHDHYDHLDYKAAKRLKHNVGKVIAPLGVGSHLEYWGYKPESITELDWEEKYSSLNQDCGSDAEEHSVTFHCTPARHFSGRGFRRNRTLWASFVLEVGGRSVFIGGDSGYGSHFKGIGEKYNLDLAIIENGQYNPRWALIHTMPENLHNVMEDLNASEYITVHHGKFALAQHNWDEPLENEKAAAEKSGKKLKVLQIGYLTDLP
ncbi:MAG: MBL fold metallo-hydrolase [Bacteroidales bacterium]|nr:MBL fold metallo-hydrolase [Bacteroidales bacterium]